MFCPKCGIRNPDNGKFCRSCGTDLKVVSAAISGRVELKQPQSLVSKKGKPISWESAFGKLFTGIAFVAVTIALANSVMGTGWWFWMLIPAISLIGAGLAQVMQIKSYEKQQPSFVSTSGDREIAGKDQMELPPTQTEFIPAENDLKYETGELVPSSVTENTTRHLELDSEGETMTLRKPNS